MKIDFSRLSVPNDWVLEPLVKRLKLNYGKSSSGLQSLGGPFPIYGTGGILGASSAFNAPGDSVLLGRKGTLDNPLYIAEPFWAVDTTYYTSDFAGSSRWLHYLFVSLGLETFSEATGVPSLSREALYQLPALFPPATEQIKIAEVLATVDRALAQADALLTKQQRVKAGLMQELLTRGIDKDGNPRTHAFKESPLGPIPVEWNCSTLADVGRWVSGGTPDKGNASFWSGSIPWASPKDMKTLYLQDTIDHLSNAGARAGTRIIPAKSIIVVVRGMILAKSFPVCLTMCDMTINQDVKGILPNQKFTSEFLAHWLVNAGTSILKIATESTHGTKRIDMKDLHAIGIPEIGLDEQKEIVSIIDAIESISSILQRTHLVLQRLKAGLMQDLLTGRVSVLPLLDERNAP
jgi:restriction endonuclease S subunit